MIYVWCVIKIFLVNPLLWLFKHKIALVAVVVLVVGFIGYQSCNNPAASQQQVSEQDRKAPTIQQAGTVLQTYSRVYYLAKFKQESASHVIVYAWYEWNGHEWKYQTSQAGVPFDKKEQGDFRLIKR
jgi:hypothetical protein